METLRSNHERFRAVALFAVVAGCTSGGANDDQPGDPGLSAMQGSAGSAAQAGATSMQPDPMQQGPSATAGSAAQPSNMNDTAGAAAEPPDDPMMDDETPPGDLPMLDPRTPWADVPAQCRGFELAGLTTSPGGSTLPNLCAPFDGTYNNPYAIRCIDADPSYDTGYPGDEWCILPPPAELGTQIHIGPSDYASPGELELAGGDEISNFYFLNTANAEARHYYRTNWRMRPGGHHLLIAMLNDDRDDGWAAFGDMGSEFGGRSKSFGGAQRADVDRPQGTLEVPPENQGLGQELAAHQQFSFNLHSVNPTTEPALREVWINIWYMDASEVSDPIDTFAGTGNPADMSIAPGQHVLAEYACAASSKTRIISLYGHYHAHDQHFSAWVERAGGERVTVYDSFDWEDIPVYQYDSISSNPTADVASRSDGALSGLLNLEAGDRLHFSCDITNDSAQALRFADEAVTGEMCILFGAYTGANPCVQVQRAN